jgi:hypothetical protein
MIFDANVGSNTTSKVSPYEPGLSGALMHVYESQCNWNAIVKSVGISELKYYNETGKDLFVNEAGAFGGFLEKVKAFFKAVKDKIVALFNKFVAFFRSKTMKSKEFAKKYGPDAKRKAASISDDIEISVVKKLLEAVPAFDSIFSYEGYRDVNFAKSVAAGANVDVLTSDQLEEAKEAERAACAKADGRMDRQEFIDKITEKLYGADDKAKDDEQLNKLVSAAVTRLEGSDKLIKDAEKGQKQSTKEIDDFIKTIDNALSKKNDLKEDQTKSAQQWIDVARVVSDCNTVAYGIYLDALKDQAKQDKAIVLKALSAKQESARYESATATSEYDLFSGVKLI